MRRSSILTRVRFLRRDRNFGRAAGISLSAAGILAAASLFFPAAFPQSTTSNFGGGPPGLQAIPEFAPARLAPGSRFQA